MSAPEQPVSGRPQQETDPPRAPLVHVQPPADPLPQAPAERPRPTSGGEGDGAVGRPRLVVVVGNPVTGDSRVQKTALAAARAGWDVTLVGRSPSRKREESVLGPVRVVKVPVSGHMRAAASAARRRSRLRSRLTQWGLPDDGAWLRARSVHAAWVREHTTRVGWLAERPSGVRTAVAREALKGWVRLRRYAHKGRGRLYQWERRHAAEPRPTGDWRRDWPELLDFDLAFGPVIEELRPDVLHANDIAMLPIAARSAARLRARGHRTAWLYDAHEYVRGIEWPDALRRAAFPAAEDAFIRRAGAVVTVSDELAALLREQYGLRRSPLVVANAPVRAAVRGAAAGERAGVRDVCGLEGDVPLLVYAGWIGPERGLDVAVEGLVGLHRAHLALVAGSKPNATLQALLALAERLGVRERVHVVPYVPQEQVPDYLSSADLGLICFRHVPNCEISLPTKAAEYLHAGLPMVTSGVRTLRAFVERTGVGEVFVAEQPRSFVAAVRRALARRDTLAGHITDELLRELSWEHQSDGLLHLYEELAGPRAAGRLVPRDVPWSAAERPGAGRAAEPAGAGDTCTAPGGWRPLTSTPVRLGLGCANSAGQLAQFARALSERRADLSAEVVMHTHEQSVRYPADVHTPAERAAELGHQLERARRVLGSCTHYLSDSFTPALGRLNGGHIRDDLPALRAAGIKVALLAHGSDVRDPERHMARYPHSHYHAADESVLAALTRKSARNRRFAAECGLPQFVTTPDLLDDLPGARWAPLVVDVASWESELPAMERCRPVVVHAPSKRWTKGTERVVPVLEELDRRGHIEFRLATGVPWERVRELVQDADIVVDQFAVGTYGTFACEGMAAGRPVVAYLDEQVHRAAGIEPPVVGATPRTLRSALESLLDDREFARRTARQSVEYVRTYHDGGYTAAVLDEFLR
ncbi:glycosyltransferase [Streptomyces cacaoi]|uniref:glycosyltransferase n=1 Tax=Streptomyces cacaoi TaxID=1898 RepID=UPI003327A28A